jgi:hypothetical protein
MTAAIPDGTRCSAEKPVVDYEDKQGKQED